jgi:uncharacterized protein
MRSQFFLIKPASSSCNMRCRYCFYADIAGHRAVKSHGVMSLDTLETIVQKALSEVTEHCSFGFQGGEPTLAGIDFFRKLIMFEKKHNVNNVKISHSLQTNGLLIDREWAEFFRENNFLTGLSIDACKQSHDALRVDAGGGGTHARCMAAARALRQNRAEFNILSVVTRPLASHPERVWRFIKNEKFRHVQFIPYLGGVSGKDDGPDNRAFGAFLCQIFDLWYLDYIKGNYISVRAFDNYIYMLSGYAPENCAMAGRCSAYPLIEADGSVYPCDFYALDAYKIGHVQTHGFREMLESDAARRFTAASGVLRSDCRRCVFYPLCRGGCRRYRDGSAAGTDYYCHAYQVFFRHSLSRMTAIAQDILFNNRRLRPAVFRGSR